MHKKILIIALLFGQCCLAAAFAQKPASQASAVPAPKTILDYRKELELTDPQVQGLTAAMDGYEKEIVRLQAKLQISQVDLMDLLDKKSDLEAIHAKLQEAFSFRAEMQFAQIVASRKIGDLLTPEQTAKWQAIFQKSVNPEAPAKSPKPPKP